MIDLVAEPITDPAALPTAILSAEAKRHVGVVLSGEGADELFGGYPTYPGHAAATRYTRWPAAAQGAIRRLIDAIPASDAKVPIRLLLRRFVAHAGKADLNRHVAWFGAQIDDRAPSPEVRAIWEASAGHLDDITQVMYFDYCTYLRALLAKIDRATMWSSLESRAPYLDPHLTRFAFGLPDHLKIGGLRTKPLLKRVASRYLPRRIVHQRKRGLSVPITQIMRTALRTEFDRLVRDERFEQLGLLPPGRVGELVSQHRDRRADHGRALWTLLVLAMWTEHWMGV